MFVGRALRKHVGNNEHEENMAEICLRYVIFSDRCEAKHVRQRMNVDLMLFPCIRTLQESISAWEPEVRKERRS